MIINPHTVVGPTQLLFQARLATHLLPPRVRRLLLLPRLGERRLLLAFLLLLDHRPDYHHVSVLLVSVEW